MGKEHSTVDSESAACSAKAFLKTAIMVLAERLLVLAGNRQDEAWMNLLVGNSEPQHAKKGPSSQRTAVEFRFRYYYSEYGS